MRTRVVAYTRVSTDKQADKGFSLESQRTKIEAYAALYDLEIVEIIVETASAKSLARDGLQAALSALREGRADALLVVKLDRLTRSVRDLGELVSGPFAPGKSALLSVAEHVDTRTAAGRMVLNIMATISQWEREVIAERTRDGMAVKKAAGHRLGRPRYGFTVENGAIVEVAEEQATIARVRALAGEGRSQREIAAAVDMHATQVSRILRAA